jgi:hypothetical protein
MREMMVPFTLINFAMCGNEIAKTMTLTLRRRIHAC